MTDHGSYTYDDSDRRLTIREMGGRVDIFVRDLDDSAMVLLPAEQRQAAAQALAGDGYRVVPADQIDAMSTDGRVRLYPSQPDRPEPVDPSEVRVGDVVEIEAEDGSWMVRGEIAAVDNSYTPPRLLIHAATEDPCWVYTSRATVRILRRAEPEPDPAAVEALAKILDSADLFVATAGERVETARRLIRDHGVHVEVPDA